MGPRHGVRIALKLAGVVGARKTIVEVPANPGLQDAGF